MKNHSQDIESLEVANQKRDQLRRYSLTTIFTTAFIIIFLLFISVTTLAYLRLIDFQTILFHITNNALPEVVQSRKIHSQVNELTYLTEDLTQASSQAFRRVAHQDIQAKITEIQDIAQGQEEDDHLEVQLKAIAKELDNLNQLIEQRLHIQNLVRFQEEAVYHIYDEALDISREIDSRPSARGGEYAWSLSFFEAVAMSGKASSMTRLQQVRQISKQLGAQFTVLERNIQKLPESAQVRAEYLTFELRRVLIEEDGLLSLKVEQRRVIGRATGHGNFVQNLVLDYARLAEYKSYELSDTVLEETQLSANRIKKQTKIIGLASIMATFILIGVIYFIQRQVVRRLITLNNTVLGRTEGGGKEVDLSGNDEISDIASSFNYFAKKIEAQKQELRALSLTDGLTSIANRRALDQKLLYDLQTSRRQQWPVSVLLMDLDNFKLFNDHYGHLAGDECLKAVANALTNCAQRAEDFVARYGGEEFVYLLPNTPLDGAKQVAKTILEAVSTLNIPHGGNRTAPHVTISIGIALATYNFQDPVDKDTLLRKADKALYMAKEQGKNRFCCFDEIEI